MATKNTVYLVRDGDAEDAAYLLWADPGAYRFTGERAAALRFVGRAAALGAAQTVEAVMARNGYPGIKLDVVPARGGVPISR